MPRSVCSYSNTARGDPRALALGAAAASAAAASVVAAAAAAAAAASFIASTTRSAACRNRVASLCSSGTCFSALSARTAAMHSTSEGSEAAATSGALAGEATSSA